MATSQAPYGDSRPGMKGGCRRTLGSPWSPEWPGPGLSNLALGWLPTPARASEEMKVWNVESFLIPASLQETEKSSFNKDLCQEVWATLLSGRPSALLAQVHGGWTWGGWPPFGAPWGPTEARVASPSAPSTNSKPPRQREETRRDQGGEPRGSHRATKRPKQAPAHVKPWSFTEPQPWN